MRPVRRPVSAPSPSLGLGALTGGSSIAFNRPRPLRRTRSEIFLQLFRLLLCPVIETQSTDMNSNIIYLDFKTPDTSRHQVKGQGTWIRIENDAAFKIIDTLLVFWLAAWTLIAGVEFLRATGSVLF